MLTADNVCAEVAIGSGSVTCHAHLFWYIEDDRGWQHVVLTCQRDQCLARIALHIGRIDDRQPTSLQPLANDVMQQIERLDCGGLVVLVVRDQAAAEVRRDDLRGTEVRSAEGRLPRAGYPDQHY